MLVPMFAMKLVFLWSASSVLETGEACMKTALENGRLSTDVLQTFTLAQGQDTCGCCGLCSSDPACASFSFHQQSRWCTLFSAVAGYDNLVPDDTWQYFVMPGRSGHHQFCQEDSDCAVDGEFCRGSVCTALEGVTCRTIYDTFGAGTRYGDVIWAAHGWINGTALTLKCNMKAGLEGATLLLQTKRHFIFTDESIWNYDDPANIVAYSILYAAESLRGLRTGDTYQLIVVSRGETITRWMEAPGNEPVIGTGPRPGVATTSSNNQGQLDRYQLCLPFYVQPGFIGLISVRCDDDTTDGESYLVRRDGRFGRWLDSTPALYMYIRE